MASRKTSDRDDVQPIVTQAGDPRQNTEEQEAPYTVFTKTQQRVIVVLVAFATVASPLTAILYLPLVPALASHFSTSIQAINLTITVYIIFQAIAPLLLSTHSDTFGRRPIYLVSFALYTAASLGISLNRSSYAALITLRAVQSLGASAVLSVSWGVVADLQPSSTRGKTLGPLLACSNLGTAIGPVIGGAIAYSKAGLWWAFWVMLIFSSSMFLSLLLLLPETARSVVGNGSITDKKWNQPLYIVCQGRSHNSDGAADTDIASKATRSLAFKSPLKPILLMRHPDAALTLWIVGTAYALWYTVQASIPVIYGSSPYEFNELQIGLSYLPGAAGVIASMYATGRAMDHNYRIIAKRHEEKANERSIQGGNGVRREESPEEDLSNATHDMSEFPIEHARSRFCSPLLLVTFVITSGYGWSLYARVHPAVPLIFQFFMGFLCTWICNMFNALIVDIFPDAPSAAATAGNLIRCGFSAAAVAILEPLTKATNRGWFFTIAGFLAAALGFVAVLTLDRYGLKWRQRRKRSRQD